MKYYLYYDERGQLVGWNASNDPVGSSAVEVTAQTFQAAGGVIPAPPAQTQNQAGDNQLTPAAQAAAPINQ